MRLTVLEVQKAKAKDKPYKMSDGAGLYLLVNPNGRKYWRLKYFFAGRERVLALGVYPDVNLATARTLRDDARKQKLNDVDPAEHKREKKREFLLTHGNTFEKVAREWHEKRSRKWSPYYTKQVMQRLEADVFPKIGHRVMDKITPADLYKIAQTIQERDAFEIAHRATSVCGQIFQYGMLTDRATHNPAIPLRGQLETGERKHRAHLTASQLPDFFKRLDAYHGELQTKLALHLIVLTMVRPSELRCAKWHEIDFEKKEWRIPAERMKMRTPHTVPLSSQAIRILTALKKMNGHWENVFPNAYGPRKFMSSNAMLFAMWTMGYKGKATVHGFRGTATTLLNESGLFHKDVIERQMAHQERNKVRAAYNHAEYIPQRRKMMQWWANFLEEHGQEVSIIPKYDQEDSKGKTT